MHSRRVAFSAVAVACAVLVSSPPVMAADVTVFAAASLKESMDEQVRRFEAASGNKVIVAYGASNALAKQIESGAPADVFISADLDWMDYLEQRKLLEPNTRSNLLDNTLVLIAPATRTSTLKIAPNFPLASTLGPDKLAMANPDSVPAGKYGKSALESLGVWKSVEGKIARTETVRAALALVARGEAPFGIVYRTDAMADTSVKVVDAFPSGSHPPIVYPIAVVAGAKSPAANALVEYLRSASARPVWEKYGFTLAH